MTVTRVEAPAPQTLSFIVGARQAAPWLDAVVMGLHLHQTATLHKLPAPTIIGDTTCPPVTTVTLDKLSPPAEPKHDVEDIAATAARRFTEADALREEANTAFKQAKKHVDFRNTGTLYEQALQRLSPPLGNPENETSFSDASAVTLRAALHSNLALASLRTSDWSSAISHADASLHYDAVRADGTKSAKAFFRRATAYESIDYLIPALSNLTAAAAAAPDDALLARQRDRVRKLAVDNLASHRKDFAEVYNVMLSSPIFNNPLLA